MDPFRARARCRCRYRIRDDSATFPATTSLSRVARKMLRFPDPWDIHHSFISYDAEFDNGNDNGLGLGLE